VSGHPSSSEGGKRFGSLPNKKEFKFWEELKMKKMITVCFLVVFGAGSAAFATTTHHMWYFDTQDLSPAPDVVDNAPGIPPAEMLVTPGPLGSWVDGAWELSGEIDIIIENDPTPRDMKIIDVMLTWSPGDLDSFLPKMPGILVSADGMTRSEMEVVNDPIAGTPWTLSTYHITIWPNPEREWIAIKGNIIVDALDIKTECIPEPATMGLLGLGSLALLRYRRKS
jgi:hypothetical protein